MRILLPQSDMADFWRLRIENLVASCSRAILLQKPLVNCYSQAGDLVVLYCDVLNEEL